MIGAVRAAGGEYAHFVFAAQARRAYQRRPAFVQYAVENKMNPDVAEAVQPAHTIGVEIFIQRDTDLGGGHQPGLAGDAEFLLVRRGNAAYAADGVLHCG